VWSRRENEYIPRACVRCSGYLAQGSIIDHEVSAIKWLAGSLTAGQLDARPRWLHRNTHMGVYSLDELAFEAKIGAGFFGNVYRVCPLGQKSGPGSSATSTEYVCLLDLMGWRFGTHVGESSSGPHLGLGERRGSHI
jgi:hypothetical protein